MLDEFEMELETLERRWEELNDVVQHARTWRIPLGHGKVLSTEGTDIDSEVWMGTALGEAKGRSTEGIQSIPYRVARIKWRSVDAREGENIEDSE
jgi:DNA mismatch repair protein MutH